MNNLILKSLNPIMIGTILASYITLGSAQEISLDKMDFQLQVKAMKQIEMLQMEKKSRTAIQKKIDSNLLYEIKKSRYDSSVYSLPFFNSGIQFNNDGTILVDIKAIVTNDLLNSIKALGGSIVSSFPQYNAVRAKILPSQLEEVATWPSVRSIRQAAIPVLNKINTSEGDVAHRAREAREAIGVNGTGIKIGVLSDSVDKLETLQASGDLPAVTVLSGQSGIPGTSEGTAMLEIVHDLAPGAQLFFATVSGGEARFAQNILNLKAVGCNIIVDDVGYPTEPAFQDGIAAQAVNTVTDNGVLYLSSAGNSGNKNSGTSGVWEGDYRPTVISNPDYQDAHDFGGGKILNTITKDATYYNLQWSDPWGLSSNDYDLFLVDTLGNIIAKSDNSQDGQQDPFEIITALPNNVDDTGYHLVVLRFSGSPRFIRLTAGNGGQLQFSTAGQIWGHTAAQNAISVAAVPWNACGINQPFCASASIENFSSDGPRKLFYKPDGSPITPGNFLQTGGSVRQKPDIAAADAVSTATPGFGSFFGTSAAAPHAAAIAALVLSTNRSLTPPQVRNLLTNNTWDIETPGIDQDSGSGIINAYAAIQAANTNTINPSTTLIARYYQSILGRAPDAGGLAYWQSEIARLQGLGVDVREAFRVMAGQFFSSAEYLSRNTGDAQYVTDLYRTFFDRAPDGGGLSYWAGQLAAGLPRSVVLFSFVFSPEFAATMQSLFGDTTSRGEIYAVVDFYRGFLNRLPDSGGFDYWLGRFRAAQCQGASAVNAEVDTISRQFAASAEYVARNRNNRDYVADLYYGFLRRGGDLAGFNYWVGQIDAGALNRDQARARFLASAEFQTRVQQIIQQGCVR